MSAVAHQGGYPALGSVRRGEAALDGVGAIVYHDVVPDHAQLLAVRLHDLSQQSWAEQDLFPWDGFYCLEARQVQPY